MKFFLEIVVRAITKANKSLRRLLKKQNSSLKTNKGKIRYALIPPHAKEGMATAFMDGATKYAPGNWKLLGIEDILEAIERHLAAIRMGEVFAKDSGIQHAAHMMAGAAMVFELIRIEMGGEDLGPVPTQKAAEEYKLARETQRGDIHRNPGFQPNCFQCSGKGDACGFHYRSTDASSTEAERLENLLEQKAAASCSHLSCDARGMEYCEYKERVGGTD